MTEITVTESEHDPKPLKNARYVIDPVAFFIALIGGPIVVTLATFWVLFIPVAALVFGGPVYLVLGTPLLLIYLRRNLGNTDGIIGLAALAVAVAFGLALGHAVLTDDRELRAFAWFYGVFGILFGPLWAIGFGWIYNSLRNDLSRKPQ